MIDADAINEMLAAEWPGANVTCDEVSAEHALASCEPGEHDIRPGGYISGPTQFAIADSVLWFLASGAAGRPEPMALTSELSIRFLRPATGQVLRARATLDRGSRRSLVATVRVWTDDEAVPCAVAQGTYVFPRSST